MEKNLKTYTETYKNFCLIMSDEYFNLHEATRDFLKQIRSKLEDEFDNIEKSDSPNISSISTLMMIAPALKKAVDGAPKNMMTTVDYKVLNSEYDLLIETLKDLLN